MRPSRLSRIMTLALMLGASFAVSAQHISRPQSQHRAGVQATTPPAGQAPETSKCQQMMSQRQEMIRRMAIMDSRLDGLVADMNQAQGSRKVDAMAQVINEMVQQRKQIRQDMMKMHERMASHMMSHGPGAGDTCPMMQEMMKDSNSVPKP